MIVSDGCIHVNARNSIVLNAICTGLRNDTPLFLCKRGIMITVLIPVDDASSSFTSREILKTLLNVVKGVCSSTLLRIHANSAYVPLAIWAMLHKAVVCCLGSV